MKIALVDAFPAASFTAEREFIKRCVDVLNRLGHEAIKVATSAEIEQYNPDLVFSTHDLAPKLTEHFTIGPLWSPTQFYKDDEARLKNIASWDLVVPIDDVTHQFAIDLHFPVRHQTAVSKHLLFPSAPVIDISEPDVENLSLAYIGVHWDGIRHEEFFRQLAKAVDLHVYGPEEAWTFLPQAYRGSIPFDGRSVFDTLNKHGVVLALHKDSHCEEGTPSMRPFEACAAKCLVITDPILPLRRIFGERLFYLDNDATVEEKVRFIKNILARARSDKKGTLDRIRSTHEIFSREASLEALLKPIIAEARNLKVSREFINAKLGDPGISVIVRCGGRPLPFVLRAVSSIARQTYQNISLIFVCFANIAGFDEYVINLKSSGRFQSVEVIKTYGASLRSTTLWTGLNAVETPFFANLDDDDEWFSQHLRDIMDVFDNHPDADFVHSGGIRHNEEGHSAHLHPRLQRKDGSWFDEQRTLDFMSPNEAGEFLNWANNILSHSFVARRSLLTESVLDDPKLNVMEDVYLYFLLMAKGARFLFNGRVSVIWNWRHKSADNSMLLYSREMRLNQAERIKRRLRNFKFPAEYLGGSVIGRGFRNQPTNTNTNTNTNVDTNINTNTNSEKNPATPQVDIVSGNIELGRDDVPFVKMSGLSWPEGWGRWTDGDIVTFRFQQSLPKKFVFEIIGHPVQHMLSRAMVVQAGIAIRRFKMTNAAKRRYKIKLRNDTFSDTITIHIPNAQSPAQVLNHPLADSRRLGIAISSIRIIPYRSMFSRISGINNPQG